MDIRSELEKRYENGLMPRIARYIGNDQARFDHLMALVFGDEPVAARRASWVIGHCTERYPHLVRPWLEKLVNSLSRPGLDDSIVRSTVKVLAETDDLPEELQGYTLEHCFDLLLNPKTAVAIQVHAMQAIFNISRDEPDLLGELREVIEGQMEYGSAGFKARGKRILGEIARVLKN
ncbi:MAG TPA: hypothetical protein PKE06_18630 [Flavilitoribacter sp.]|nr:hypothetical protein [Flavilitoribacter sp.]HMQ89936.1 hypothetical protein [Flavilitoribacter sp.]